MAEVRGWQAAFVATIVAGVGVALVGLISFNVMRAARLDAEGFEGFWVLHQGNLPRVNLVLASQDITDSVTPLVFLPIALILVALALERRRPVIVAAIAGILVGSVLSTTALKSAIGERSVSVLPIGGPSFPSGHATASMALVLCVVLASPAEWQGLVTGLGAIYAIAVGYALIVLGGHLPSDVVGGYLMAALCAFLAVLLLRVIESRLGLARNCSRDATPRLKPLVALLLAFSVAVAATLLAVAHAPQQPAPAAFIASAIGVALVAVVVIYVFARLSSDWDGAVSGRPHAIEPSPQRG